MNRKLHSLIMAPDPHFALFIGQRRREITGNEERQGSREIFRRISVDSLASGRKLDGFGNKKLSRNLQFKGSSLFFVSF